MYILWSNILEKHIINCSKKLDDIFKYCNDNNIIFQILNKPTYFIDFSPNNNSIINYYINELYIDNPNDNILYVLEIHFKSNYCEHFYIHFETDYNMLYSILLEYVDTTDNLIQCLDKIENCGEFYYNNMTFTIYIVNIN